MLVDKQPPSIEAAISVGYLKRSQFSFTLYNSRDINENYYSQEKRTGGLKE